MNIRHYYEQSAIASIHAGLIAFIPAIALLLYIFLHSKRMELIILIIPFLLYSFSCYLRFLQNQKRAHAVQIDSIDEEQTTNHGSYDGSFHCLHSHAGNRTLGAPFGRTT